MSNRPVNSAGLFPGLFNSRVRERIGLISDCQFDSAFSGDLGGEMLGVLSRVNGCKPREIRPQMRPLISLL
jgi:hypothetical protein